MPKTLYEYTIVPTDGGGQFPVYYATHHEETGDFVRGKFVLYNEDEIVGEIMQAYMKAWSREKVNSSL